MKVDELRSTIGEDEDVDALCSKNKDLQEQLAFSEDARARAVYDITKAKTIQKACKMILKIVCGTMNIFSRKFAANNLNKFNNSIANLQQNLPKESSGNMLFWYFCRGGTTMTKLFIVKSFDVKIPKTVGLRK
ncbi:hypothetical protein Fot_37442 [Forsythia ovata]|uniref:Uncharacterized protein n=1 Tax=Forsythia ovata TaxID=205694 RepID=A0ABD1RZ04_9LAMI